MNRSGDTSLFVACVARMRDFVLRARQRQSAFSIVSSLLAAVLVITFGVDLLVGHPGLKQATTGMWLVSFCLVMVIPLVAGHRFPHWGGLLVVVYYAAWSGHFVAIDVHPHTQLNALFQVPMVGLYLGWFYQQWIARAGLAVNLGVIIFSVFAVGREPDSHEFSTPIAVAYAVIISIFCLEAGFYLRRRELKRASHDPLTRVLNRRGLSVHGRKAVARAHRTGDPLTIAVVDFDDFKSVNDEGGHAAGDEALCATARTWKEGLEPRDLVARIGGDEFVLLIHADRETANIRLREISEDAPYSWSWGLTQIREGDTIDDLVTRADVRMYDAKGRREGQWNSR